METVEAAEGWALPDGGIDGDIASHLSVCPRDELHSAAELRYLGVCAVRRDPAPDADGAHPTMPPCELRVRLVQGGCRVSTLELVSNAGLAEVYVQGERDAAPSYLSTARAEKLDLVAAGNGDAEGGEDSLSTELMRIVLPVPHSPTWQAVNLKLQSLRGDKSCLQLAILALHVAKGDPEQAGPEAAGTSDEISSSPAGTTSAESQMDEVRSFLDGILHGRNPHGDAPAQARLPVVRADPAGASSAPGLKPSPHMPASMKGLIASLAKARSLGSPQPGSAPGRSTAAQPASSSSAALAAAAPTALPFLRDAMQEHVGEVREAVTTAAAQVAASQEASRKALEARVEGLEAATQRIEGKLDEVLQLLRGAFSTTEPKHTAQPLD